MSDKKERLSLFKRIVSLALTTLLLLVAINFYQGFSKLRSMDSEIESLKEEIEKKVEEKEELKRELEYLETEDYVEQIAREKLGLVKDGEILYINIYK